MSLILDALRKMEQDRKSRRGAALDIRPEVLRYRARVKTQQAKPYLLVTIGLVLVVAGIAAGVFLKGNRRVTVSQSAEPTAVTESAPTAPPMPAPMTAPPAPPAPPVAPVALPTPTPALPAPGVAVPARPPFSDSAPVEQAVANPVRKTAQARPARAAAAGVPQPKPLHPDAAEDAQGTIPDIAISGIAYQDERNLRRAVLNGVLVGEGAEVAGARVVEIKENRVRLSRGGHVFDVVFSSGLSPR